MLPPLILAAIKVRSQEERSYNDRALAYGLTAPHSAIGAGHYIKYNNGR